MPARPRQLAGASLLLLALASIVAWLAHADLSQPAIDFYNIWGVGRAHAELGGNPYADADAYSRKLASIADASGEAGLRETHARRPVIDPTGTPFFYALFALLPRDFAPARRVMLLLTVGAFVAGAWSMARMRGLSQAVAFALAALGLWGLIPFEVDARVGNVNALQLAMLVALIRCAEPVPRRLRRDVLYAGALALFVVFKPITLLVAAALAIHYAITRPRNSLIAGCAAVVVAGAASIAVGALYFGSLGAWSDWYRFTRDLGPGGPGYAVFLGNVSLARMFSERYGIGAGIAGLVLGAVVLALLAGALTSFGRRPEALGSRWREVARDPWCLAGLAVVLTFAVSPLVWPHYEVLALVPAFWLFRRDGRSDAATVCVIASLVLVTWPLALLLRAANLEKAILSALMIGWLPLVGGFCARFAAASRVRQFPP